MRQVLKVLTKSVVAKVVLLNSHDIDGGGEARYNNYSLPCLSLEYVVGCVELELELKWKKHNSHPKLEAVVALRSIKWVHSLHEKHFEERPQENEYSQRLNQFDRRLKLEDHDA